jgi:hypothetical protein
VREDSVFLIAEDTAPSDALSYVTEAFARLGLTTTSLFGRGKTISESDEEIRSLVSGSSFVLSGLSSGVGKTKREELVAIEAAKTTGIPYGLFADIWNGWRREAFADFVGQASLLFVLDVTEVINAGFLYPNIGLVVPAGNPAWDDYAFISTAREDVCRSLGIEAGAKIILVAGGKDFGINQDMLTKVLEACNFCRIKFSLDVHIHIIFSLHPGDHSDMMSYSAIFSNFPFSHHVVGNILSTVSMVPASDLIISPASSIEIAGALHRKPTISFLTKGVRDRIERLIGTRQWGLEPLMVSRVSEGEAEALATLIFSLLAFDWHAF